MPTMQNMQNTYTPDMSMRTADGRRMEAIDWSGEITMPPGMQRQVRPAQDTGMGGMAASDTMPGTGMMPGMGMVNAERMAMPQMSQMPTLDMRHGQPSEVVEAPTSLQEAYLGSLKATLSRNKGNYIVATFLIGTQNTVSFEGILYEVGNDFVTIYQPGRDRYIVVDMYSLKYMEFYDIQRQEMCNELLRQSGWQQNR